MKVEFLSKAYVTEISHVSLNFRVTLLNWMFAAEITLYRELNYFNIIIRIIVNTMTKQFIYTVK